MSTLASSLAHFSDPLSEIRSGDNLASTLLAELLVIIIVIIIIVVVVVVVFGVLV